MNLEQIDTSTTAGKAEVMRLAADGRKVFVKFKGEDYVIDTVEDPNHEWDWRNRDYVVAAQPVGPNEVWGMVLKKDPNRVHCHTDKDLVESWAGDEGGTVVRYVRADR